MKRAIWGDTEQIAPYVHKDPWIIQAVSYESLLLCYAESHYILPCSNHVKRLLMYTGGASVRPLSVSDWNRYDPQHLDTYVDRREEKKKPDETQAG